MSRILQGTRVVVTTDTTLLDAAGIPNLFAGKEYVVLEDDGNDDNATGLPYRLSATAEPTPAAAHSSGLTHYWAHSGVLTVQDENHAAASDPYASLGRVYSLAVEQASKGKGAERHVVQADEPFETQLITEIGKRLGNTGFELGQAVKKTYEASGMLNRSEKAAARRELLGAMNYLAAAYIMTRED